MADQLQTTDVVLVNAGIMSAKSGSMLKELQPNISIAILERLDVAAAESSDAWNNAGTGHSAFCELNYTPKKKTEPLIQRRLLKLPISLKYPNNCGVI